MNRFKGQCFTKKLVYVAKEVIILAIFVALSWCYLWAFRGV